MFRKYFCHQDILIRGTMAPKRKVDKNTLTKAEKIKFIQVGKQRDKKTDEWRNVILIPQHISRFAEYGVETQLHGKVRTWRRIN